MKGILEFNLPEDSEDFELAKHGWKYKALLDDFYNYLRSKSKYEDIESLTIEEIREELLALRNRYELND